MKELIKEITSVDGTKIGYRQIGKGEGLNRIIICIEGIL